PDKNRYKLSGTMTLTASYQKNVKATKPKPSPAKPKAETKAETKAEPAKSKSKSETKPAKKSGTKRSVPSRRVRTIDQ
ncbi:MAG: hypothetical protein QGF29_04485, partial [Verrucomicrobiota bacterium]|nr:hypothetical protein [Verrucomicrobiota bacterium]